jgi:hypothetical protein
LRSVHGAAQTSDCLSTIPPGRGAHLRRAAHRLASTTGSAPPMRCVRATCFAKASFPLASTSAATSPPFAQRVARLAAHLRPLHTRSQVSAPTPLPYRERGLDRIVVRCVAPCPATVDAKPRTGRHAATSMGAGPCVPHSGWHTAPCVRFVSSAPFGGTRHTTIGCKGRGDHERTKEHLGSWGSALLRQCTAFTTSRCVASQR